MIEESSAYGKSKTRQAYVSIAVKVSIGVLVVVIVVLLAFYLTRSKSSSSTSTRTDIRIDNKTTVDIAPIEPDIPLVEVKVPAYDIFNVKSSNTQEAGPNEIKGLVCKDATDGSFVTTIKARAGDYIDAISIACSDDSTIYDFAGGSGGSLVNIDSKIDGF